MFVYESFDHICFIIENGSRFVFSQNNKNDKTEFFLRFGNQKNVVRQQSNKLY